MASYMFESTGELVGSMENTLHGLGEYDDFLANGSPDRYLLTSKSGNWYCWYLMNPTSNYHWWKRIYDLENVPSHLRAMALLLK